MVKAEYLVTGRSHVSFVTINTVIIVMLTLLSHQSIYICYSNVWPTDGAWKQAIGVLDGPPLTGDLFIWPEFLQEYSRFSLGLEIADALSTHSKAASLNGSCFWCTFSFPPQLSSSLSLSSFLSFQMPFPHFTLYNLILISERSG